jgi:hypothetical protein
MTLAKLRQLVKAAHGTLEIVEGDPFEVLVQAPHGYTWASGVHELVTSAWDDDTRATVYASAAKDLAGNTQLIACTDDCEWCFGEGGLQ